MTGQQAKPSLQAPKVAHVRAQSVKWLWPGRIPRGKVTVLDGDPGLGKSTFTLDLMARLSTASPLPDGARVEYAGNSILLSAEDSIADTIRPRLEAHGADVDRVTVFQSITDKTGERPPELPGDLNLLESLVHEDDAKLVVIDPIMAYLSGRIDAYRDQDIRRVLHALAALADRTGISIVVLRHLNKMQGGSAMYRGGGSIGIIGAARSGMLIAEDPDDDGRRILAMTKSNLAVMPKSLVYRLVSDEEHDCGRIVWEGTSDIDANGLVNPVRKTKEDVAVEFLEDVLADGPVFVTDVEEQADAKGIRPITLRRAKKQLGVKAFRAGGKGESVGSGAWYWTLPTNMIIEQPDHDQHDHPLHANLSTLKDAGQRAFSDDQQTNMIIDHVRADHVAPNPIDSAVAVVVDAFDAETVVDP